jgi:hypothetical protein
MDFLDLGRSILRNHDRLRRNLSDKYFGSANSGTQYTRSEADRKENMIFQNLKNAWLPNFS